MKRLISNRLAQLETTRPKPTDATEMTDSELQDFLAKDAEQLAPYLSEAAFQNLIDYRDRKVASLDDSTLQEVLDHD